MLCVPKDKTTQHRRRAKRADPGLYRAYEPPSRPRHEHRLTPDEVERLYGACRTHRERALLALLAEAAYRAGAIERSRMHNVWDAARSVVLEVIALEEKGSRTRRNGYRSLSLREGRERVGSTVPSPRLRDALSAYILHERRGAPEDAWLFPCVRTPSLPARHAAFHAVARLCRRVGLTNVSPHARAMDGSCFLDTSPHGPPFHVPTVRGERGHEARLPVGGRFMPSRR